MTGDQLLDAFECGTPKELWERTVAHLEIRAAHSREIARSLERDARDALEQSKGHHEAAQEFAQLAAAMRDAPVTFAADGLEARRAAMAEMVRLEEEMGLYDTGEAIPPASADTRPEGGDAKQAPFTSGAVGEAETPK